MKPTVIAGLAHDMETILRSITRYTRFVRSTKVMLGLLAVILTCAILFYPYIKKDNGLRIAFTSIAKQASTSQTQMLNARFHGLDKDNQPYNLNAKTATQLDDDTLDLNHPIGDITLKNSAWLSVAGNNGLFKIKEKLLDLKGAIEMFNNEGYEFRTEHMHVNIGDKTAVTHDEVNGQGPLGKLKALGGANINGVTQVITFEGPVFVTVYPSQREPATTTPVTEP